MASKRTIKKELNYVSSELYAEAVAAAYFSTHEDKDANLAAILNAILHVHSDYIKRVSHPEPGMKAKKYYGVLVTSYMKDVDEIIDQIRHML